MGLRNLWPHSMGFRSVVQYEGLGLEQTSSEDVSLTLKRPKI